MQNQGKMKTNLLHVQAWKSYINLNSSLEYFYTKTRTFFVSEGGKFA